MPVPKDKEAKYGVIIASQIDLAKKKGASDSEAKAIGKQKAEKWLSDSKKKKK